MNANEPVVTTRDECQPARERDVLGRAIRGEETHDLARVRSVHGDPAPFTGRHPHMTAARGENDVVRGERGRDRPLEPWAPRVPKIRIATRSAFDPSAVHSVVPS